MTDDDATAAGSSAPVAVKKTRRERGLSPIWIIPLVALGIGLYLIYRVVSESGPTITISFNAAAGIEAGKTQVKFKNVVVGEVTEVDINDDLSGVTITVSMAVKTEQYLTEKSRFWIVQARISGTNISGLSTLLSGDYIGMDPSAEGARIKSFVGLERPPPVLFDEDGHHFKLRAKELGGLDFGSPVYFRQIPVGRVADYKSLENGDIELQIFVRAPYDKHVNKATRFWNAGGIDISLGAQGVEIKTQSLMTIVSGGVAFDTVPGIGQKAVQAVTNGHEFRLYPSHTSSRQRSYTDKRKLMFYFDDPVRGLKRGAPVELRGFQIGEVLDISFEFDREQSDFRIPVLAEIQPQRVKIVGEENFNTVMENLVAKGLRARLESGNIVLGQLMISLDFHPDAPPAEADLSGPHPVIPTVRSTLNVLTGDATALIKELRQTGRTINDFLGSQEFRASVDDLASALSHIKLIAAQIDQEAAPKLTAVLSETASTLGEAQVMLASNSTTRTEINRLLGELAEAARSIRLLADYLEQHPESIIKGKD